MTSVQWYHNKTKQKRWRFNRRKGSLMNTEAVCKPTKGDLTKKKWLTSSPTRMGNLLN